MQQNNDVLMFSYDASGNVVSVDYNGDEYYYLRNAQGDIVKLIDASGASVVEYTYDTWGKKVTTTGTLAGAFVLEMVLPQSKRRFSAGSMRADSGVNEAPVGLQSRIVTEPAGEKRLLKAPLQVLLFWSRYSLNRSGALSLPTFCGSVPAGAVLFGVGTPMIEGARQRLGKKQNIFHRF